MSFPRDATILGKLLAFRIGLSGIHALLERIPLFQLRIDVILYAFCFGIVDANKFRILLFEKGDLVIQHKILNGSDGQSIVCLAILLQ